MRRTFGPRGAARKLLPNWARRAIQSGCDREPAMAKPQELTEGQRAYEARRAAKAGMSLEKWLVDKEKRARADAVEVAKLAEAEKPKIEAPKGWLGRLLDRAHKPIK